MTLDRLSHRYAALGLALSALLLGACGGADSATLSAPATTAPSEAPSATVDDGTGTSEAETGDEAGGGGLELVIPTPTATAVVEGDAGEEGATDEVVPTPTVEATAPPTDPPLPADEDEPEGTGEPIFAFDEAAALVCANAEYALDSADAGDDAAYQDTASTMAEWAATTTAEEIADLARPVIDAASAAAGREAVVTLLEACADAGYQL